MRTTLLWLAIVGCGGSKAPPVPEVEPAPAPAPAPAPEPAPAAATAPPTLPWSVEGHMHQSFALATDAVYHTIRGDLDAARAEGAGLRALAEPEGGWPDGWTPHVEALTTAAGAVAEAADLDASAAGAVAIGQACAGCHTSLGGPELTVDDVVGSTWPTDSAMDRHQWAAYLMWLGVMGPSADVFAAGVGQLAHPDGPMPEVPESVAALEARVHTLAETAAAATTDAARAEAYVGFLQTCAGCHSALSVVLP